MKKVWHHTKEAKEKISEAQKGEKNHNYGKHLMGENSPHWKGGKIYIGFLRQKSKNQPKDV
jgi:hypothetical protein